MVEQETFGEKPIIKVVGVGGGGGNAINRMIENDVKGVDFISVDEYIKFSLSDRNKCLITFDDGLQDVYRVVYPELKKRGIPFLMFVIWFHSNKNTRFLNFY